MNKKIHTSQYLAGLLEELEMVDAFYTEHFKHLSLKQLHWKPDQKTWSIAQNVEHIILVDNGYIAHMEKILTKSKNQQKSPKEDFQSDWMGNRFKKALDPDSNEKFKSPKIFNPSENPNHVESRLYESSRSLKSFIQKSAQYNLNIRIPLLESRLIRLRLGDRLKTLIMHKIRHFKQAYQVKLHPEFPTIK